ncbi:hypothetical protein VO64_4513 [Pseudomonas synxantha]|uniref:Uncharacterized protein n=1 Tax=Pseudomonas synxantha TaxID=47883 RepID=A0AAU8TWV6_9PSED|nr:hypothetical protein VO64_4513 [Pseudomonas synxantha]
MFQPVAQANLRKRVSFFDTSIEIYPFVGHRVNRHAQTS